MATTIFPWISCISQVHAEVCFFFCLDLDAFPLSTISENVLANNFAKRTVSVTFLLYAQEGEAAKLKWCLCCPVRVNDRLLWKNKLLWKSSSDYSRLDYCVLSMTGYFALSNSNSTTYWKLTVSGNCNQSIVLIECILKCERGIWFVAGFSASKIIFFYLFFVLKLTSRATVIVTTGYIKYANRKSQKASFLSRF